MMIVVVIIGIILAIAYPIFSGRKLNNSTVSMGYNGVAESRCIDGYKFILSRSGDARQIMDEAGHGVKCTNGGIQ